MTKYLLTLIVTVSSFIQTAQAQDIACLAVEKTLGDQGARIYGVDIMTIIDWTTTSVTDDEVDLQSTEDAQSSTENVIIGKDNIIWEDAILIRDAYYKLLKKYKVSYQSKIQGMSIQDYMYKTESSPIKGAEYLLSYEIVSVDEKTKKQSLYKMTFGIYYTYDTCSGKGYTPAETGVKVVTNKDNRVLAIFKKIK